MTIRTVCEGSGQNMEAIVTDEKGRRTATCPVCDSKWGVTKFGNLRKHDNPLAGMLEAAEERRSLKRLLATGSLREMAEDAMTLKTSLWNRYQSTKDPRFRRLWQHAYALEKHLADLYDEEATVRPRLVFRQHRDNVV